MFTQKEKPQQKNLNGIGKGRSKKKLPSGHFDGIGEALIFQTKENEEIAEKNTQRWSSPFLMFSLVLTLVALQRGFNPPIVFK